MLLGFSFVFVLEFSPKRPNTSFSALNEGYVQILAPVVTHSDTTRKLPQHYFDLV